MTVSCILCATYRICCIQQFGLLTNITRFLMRKGEEMWERAEWRRRQLRMEEEARQGPLPTPRFQHYSLQGHGDKSVLLSHPGGLWWYVQNPQESNTASKDDETWGPETQWSWRAWVLQVSEVVILIFILSVSQTQHTTNTHTHTHTHI